MKVLCLRLLVLDVKTTSPEWPSKQGGGINFDCTLPPVLLTA